MGGLSQVFIEKGGVVLSVEAQSIRRAGQKYFFAVFLIGGQEPVDQYFMRHPQALFERNPEKAVITWSNPYILVRHLVRAAYELPLSSQDECFFGDDLRAMLTLLSEEGTLREAGDCWYDRKSVV